MIFLRKFLVLILVFFFTSQHALRATCVSVQSCIDKALDAWTMFDTARAIAQEDRRYLYKDLVKANLDLYAHVYWFAQQKPLVSHEIRHEVDTIFTALSNSQQNIFGLPKTPEEASLGTILQETIEVWDGLNNTSSR